MEPSKESQAIVITRSQLSNVQIGGQAGGDLAVAQSQSTRDGAPEQLTPSDVAVLLEQLKALLKASDLSKEDKTKVTRSLDTIQDEVQANDPDKAFAAKNLQRAARVLKEANETVEAGTSLWQQVKPIVETIAPWLGVVASSLI